MPRTYKPDPRSSKRYKKYDHEIIKNALELVKNGKSYREVASEFGISKSVLCRHNLRHTKKQGGQKVLSDEIENLIIENINICAEWGYPLDTYDLRLIVKGYLDRRGKNIPKFKNNFPGRDFAESFLKRHKSKISQRMSQNIKRCRAQISVDTISDYFDHLESSLCDVDPANIVNYDETNLSDDPGRKKIITKRGCKYPEKIVNFSKSSTSIMYAGSAAGDILPVYVVYKATNMYDTWTQGGPPLARYNRTVSGWFDGDTFEDWINTIVIPYFQNKLGKKILIGDNLSSHLSIDAIKKCRDHNIHFVFLPSNSTHLTQPLDVAFFRPLKMAWRDILATWKENDGRKETAIPKSVFPRLLKKLSDKISLNAGNSIIAGFKKTGLHPLNRNVVLDQLPKESQNDHHGAKELNESVVSLLKDLRYPDSSNKNDKKKKKISLQAGKSVDEKCIESLEQGVNTTQKRVKTQKKVALKTKRNKTKLINLKSSSYCENTESKNIQVADIIIHQAEGTDESSKCASKINVIAIYDKNGQAIQELVDVTPSEYYRAEPLKVLDQNTFNEEIMERTAIIIEGEAMEVEGKEIYSLVDEDKQIKQPNVVKSRENTAPEGEKSVKPNTILKLHRQHCCACNYVEYYKLRKSNWTSIGWMKCIVCKNFACPTCATDALSCEFICTKCYGV